MDWNAAIDRNRQALLDVLAALLAMAGFAAAPRKSPVSPTADCPLPTAATIPRHLHRAVLRLLRPAEAAVRRLVIVAARGLAVALPPLRVRRARAGRRRRAVARRAPGLALFDPLRYPGRVRLRASAAMPRISFPGVTAPAPLRPKPTPYDRIDTTSLGLRLSALGAVLDDLPRQARRFALWQARLAEARSAANEAATAPQSAPAGSRGPLRRRPGPVRFRRVWPLRPGRPPGGRAPRSGRPSHEVHDILAVTHDLAIWALEPPDTS